MPNSTKTGLEKLLEEPEKLLQQPERLLAELERAQDELQTIFDHFPGFIFHKDTENNILRVNRAMAESLGLRPRDMAGRHAREFYPELADAYYEDDLQVIRSGRPKLGIVEPVDLEGGNRGWLETNKVPLTNDDGEIVGVLGIAVEVTARIHAQEERERLIQELAKELDNFTSTVSHDLKSPVVTMTGFLRLLEDDLNEGNLERAKSDLQHVRKATESLSGMIHGMLELSRSTHRETPQDEVALSALVDDVLEVLAAPIRTIHAECRVDADLPLVVGDRTRLFSLYKNLVENAIKYMGEQTQPRIEIGTREENGEQVFFVRDNGSGIDTADQKEIFKIFKRRDSHSEIDGTGLGLAIVERAVTAHGGRVWVESAGRGQGSSFFFTLAPQTTRG